jgi:chorismate lyase/3-hydroxybenzoate synthase
MNELGICISAARDCHRSASAPPPPQWVGPLLSGSAVAQVRQVGPCTIEGRYSRAFSLVAARIAQAGALDGAELERATSQAYRAILQSLGGKEAPHPVRFWNHIPGLGMAMARGRDRYQSFNAGRFAAFGEFFGVGEESLKEIATASAIGHDGGDLVIYCLAADAPGTAAENPRQISAYRYSARYGRIPPCFARATVLAKRQLILVGGTASVRGEDSFHIGDIELQTEETLENLASIVRAACEGHTRGSREAALRRFTELRVYYPNPEHGPMLGRLVGRAFSWIPRIEWIRAELCRAELLVEIEGVTGVLPS